MATTSSNPVVFFDGECPFCNRWAWRLRSFDTKGRLRFAPLQGETARLLLPSELRPVGRPETMILWLPSEGAIPAVIHVRSQAALRAFRLTDSWLSLLACFGLWFPTSWSDAVYGLIERRRERGRKSVCPLPTAADRAVLLP